MNRFLLIAKLIIKKWGWFWIALPFFVTAAAWFIPNISLLLKFQFTLFIALILFIVVLLQVIIDLITITEAKQVEVKPVHSQIVVSEELNDIKVLSAHEYNDDLILIVTPSLVLGVDTVVSILCKDSKNRESHFAIGVVTYIQSDKLVQITLKKVHYSPQQSQQKLLQGNKKLLSCLKLTTFISIKFLNGLEQ